MNKPIVAKATVPLDGMIGKRFVLIVAPEAEEIPALTSITPPIVITDDPAMLVGKKKVAAFVSTPGGDRVRQFDSWRAAFDASAVIVTEVFPRVVRKPYTRRKKGGGQ